MNKKILERCRERHVKAIDVLTRNCPELNLKCLRISKLICEDLLYESAVPHVTNDEFCWVRPGPNPNDHTVEFSKICKEYELIYKDYYETSTSISRRTIS